MTQTQAADRARIDAITAANAAARIVEYAAIAANHNARTAHEHAFAQDAITAAAVAAANAAHDAIRIATITARHDAARKASTAADAAARV